MPEARVVAALMSWITRQERLDSDISQEAVSTLSRVALLSFAAPDPKLRSKFNDKLEQYLWKNRGVLLNQISKMDAMNFVFTFSVARIGSDRFWAETLLPLISLALTRHTKHLKGDVAKVLSKDEALSLAHSLAMRRVADPHMWTIVLKVVSSLLNNASLNGKELVRLTSDLRTVKLSS